MRGPLWIPVPIARGILPACAPLAHPILPPVDAMNSVFPPPALARDSFPVRIFARCAPPLPALPAPLILLRAPQLASAFRLGPLPCAFARCARPVRWRHQSVDSVDPLRI